MMRCVELEEQIEAMRAALEEGKGDFWEARRAALPYFKESIHPAIRKRCWEKFRELSDQARA